MCILAKIESKSAQSSAREDFQSPLLPRIRDHMQAPPTPNSQRGYVPYGDLPFSPAPYSDFAPQTGASELYIADDDEGVFVSADEVLKLREWANERNQLQESLAAAEACPRAREWEFPSMLQQNSLKRCFMVELF